MSKRWSTVILLLGLFLVLGSLSAQADPYDHPYYHQPHGNAYGWHEGHHDFDRHRDYWRHAYMHPDRPYMRQFYAGPPPLAYAAPVVPMIGMAPCPQAQPFYAPPAPPGLHGQLTF